LTKGNACTTGQFGYWAKRGTDYFFNQLRVLVSRFDNLIFPGVKKKSVLFHLSPPEIEQKVTINVPEYRWEDG